VLAAFEAGASIPGYGTARVANIRDYRYGPYVTCEAEVQLLELR
jgi:hypothetical protein